LGHAECTLLRAEEALDGRVYVEMNVLRVEAAHKREAVLDHQLLQGADGLVIESAKVTVDGIEAGNDASGETDEERIGGE